jgi:uncharacterized protein (TIGR02246 family)
MKTFRIVPLLVFLTSFQAVAAPPETTDATREADHAALRQLRDKAVSAINNLDAAALAPCFAKEFAFTTVTQDVLTTREEAQAYFDRMFRSDKALISRLTIEPTADILTRFIDENTGVCYGSTKDTYTLKSGQTVTMNNRWSATVVKEDGEWKVAMAHAGTNFLDNPVLNRAAGLARKLAIGAGLGGLVLGAVLGRLLGGRNRGPRTVPE